MPQFNPRSLETRVRALYGDAQEMLVGCELPLPSGPYRGRLAVVESVGLDGRGVHLWVRIPRLDGRGWLENDGARRWRAWRVDKVADLLREKPTLSP